MKKAVIITLSLVFLSSCSFINENKIEENDTIELETFINQESNTNTGINEEIIEIENAEKEIEDLIDLLLE